jgi:hypothetical protein
MSQSKKSCTKSNNCPGAKLIIFQGDHCQYLHSGNPERKFELCKFYLMDCCAKKEKCLYMHSDFPCKYFHTGMKCFAKENCKFSHEPLSEKTREILLKVYILIILWCPIAIYFLKVYSGRLCRKSKWLEFSHYKVQNLF